MIPGSPTTRRVLRLWIALIVCASAQPGRAEPDANTKPASPEASARYLPVRDVEVRQEGIIVRGGVSLTAPAHRWYRVSFALLRGDQEDQAGGTETDWGNLFTPSSPTPVVWDDLRMGFTRDEIASAAVSGTDLQTLCVVCRLYPPDEAKPLKGAWEARLRLLVKLDGIGRLVTLEPVRPAPMTASRAREAIPIEARRMKLADGPLALTDKTALWRATDPAGNTHLLLRRGRELTWLDSPNRGLFFKKIDTARKARDLVSIGLPGAYRIADAEQYAQVRQAAGALDAATKSPPEDFRCRVEPLASVGFRVRMVVLTAPGARTPSQVVRVNTIVLPDGGLDDRSEVLIDAPDSPTGRAAFERLMDRQRDVLTGQELPAMLEATDQRGRIGCPPHRSAGDWLDPANWAHPVD
jgi:hypothetical protein